LPNYAVIGCRHRNNKFLDIQCRQLVSGTVLPNMLHFPLHWKYPIHSHFRFLYFQASITVDHILTEERASIILSRYSEPQ
jgi:hypothetical protein